MGIRSDGSHVFGVVLPADPLTREQHMEVVEATSYAIAWGMDAEGGRLLTLTDIDGAVVRQFAPHTWEEVLSEVPGVDDPVRMLEL